jgi:hypothetical protein
MSPSTNPENSPGSPKALLRTIALTSVFAGAVGSLGFTLYTGRHNASFLLILLFTTWVLSPFIGLLVADIFYKRKSNLTHMRLYYLMLASSILSLISYSGVLSPSDAKPAGVFLIVPLISWLLLILMLITLSWTGKLKR